MKERKGNKDLTILGVDPGSNIMGFALLQANGKGDTKVLCMDHLDIRKLGSAPAKLKQIYQSIERLIEMYDPDEAAFEAPFFGKNVQSMLKLGRAQGMAMAPVILREIPLFEYSPKKIKQVITGNGNAKKDQVARMLYHQLDLNVSPEQLDASDALATALCHFHQRDRIDNGDDSKAKRKASQSWEGFVRDNPDLVS